jgi:hypothetical protein
MDPISDVSKIELNREIWWSDHVPYTLIFKNSENLI